MLPADAELLALERAHAEVAALREKVNAAVRCARRGDDAALRAIERLVIEHEAELLEAWHDFFAG